MSCAPFSAPRGTSPKIGDSNWLATLIAQARAADRQPESGRSACPAVCRPGPVSQSQASVRLRETPAVPDQPDCGWVDDWLHRSHLDFWASHRYPTPQRGQKQMPIDGCLTTASDDAAGPGPG